MALTSPGHVPKGPSCRCVDTAGGALLLSGVLEHLPGPAVVPSPGDPELWQLPPGGPCRRQSWQLGTHPAVPRRPQRPDAGFHGGALYLPGPA